MTVLIPTGWKSHFPSGFYCCQREDASDMPVISRRQQHLLSSLIISMCLWLLGNPIAGVWRCPQALSPCRVSIPSGGHTAQPTSIPTDNSQVCESTAHGTAAMHPLEGMWRQMEPHELCHGNHPHGSTPRKPLSNSQCPSAALGRTASQCRIILQDAPSLWQHCAVLGCTSSSLPISVLLSH